MEKSRTCEICNIINGIVPRTSYAKHMRSKSHLDIMRQDEMIIPEYFI